MASVAIDVQGPGPDDRATRLYEAHSEWLLQYCRRQLGDREDAEDAVQTTFLYAFRALRRGVLPECERAWLTTIARNVCHSQRRTRQRHPECAELELDRIALAQPDQEEVGFLDEVRSALASLPENQRRALVLREWRGASSEEIATELELSEPATHALLFRARRSFASAMSASRRSVAGLNVAAVLEQLRVLVKPLLGGASAKALVVATAAGVLVGGAVLEQRADRAAPAAERPATPASKTTPTAPDPSVSPSREPFRAARPRVGASVPPRDARRPVANAESPAKVAAADGPTERYRRPPEPAPEAPAPPPPPSSDAPSPPVALPPVTPPVPAPPVDLPPILGGDPPVDLPPPVDELVPPAELPPVDPASLPPMPGLQLPLP